MEKNEYGRRTWDVAEYERRANSLRESGRKKVKGDTKLEESAYGDIQFGADNAWFNCKLCNRRFKNSLKLAEHLNSKQHLENLGGNGDGDGNGDKALDMPITLENVKKFVNKLDN